jgi:hypothetical protein
MPETIKKGCDGQDKWHWYNIARDLEKQGELPRVIIDPLSVGPHGCGGQTAKGTQFFITWYVDHLLLSMPQEKPEAELVEAFSRVLGYQPFASYVLKDTPALITYEWDKKTPAKNFVSLKKEEQEGNVSQVRKLKPRRRAKQ